MQTNQRPYTTLVITAGARVVYTHGNGNTYTGQITGVVKNTRLVRVQHDDGTDKIVGDWILRNEPIPCGCPSCGSRIANAFCLYCPSYC